MLKFLPCRNSASILGQYQCSKILSKRYSNTASADTKVYELRRYLIKPNCYSQYLKLMESHMQTRVAVSRCLGFWTCEIGSSLNEVFHIWEYDSLQHRADVRLALSKNQAWLSGFISKAVDMFDKQSNTLCYMPTWCAEPNTSKDVNGVYELETYDLKIDDKHLWETQFKDFVKAQTKPGLSDVLGVWYSHIGKQNTVQMVWKYGSCDARAECKSRALENGVLSSQESQNNIPSSSCLMLPASWTLL